MVRFTTFHIEKYPLKNVISIFYTQSVECGIFQAHNNYIN